MRFSLLILLALLWPQVVGANEVESKKSELEALKQRLQSLQREFRAAEEHRSEAADELRQSERSISEAVRQLRQLEIEQRRANTDLAALQEAFAATEKRIEQQQARLTEAIRAAHQRGQSDALKLLLSGRDPNQTARDLRYLASLSRAQMELIESLKADLAKLEQLKIQASNTSAELAELREARLKEQKKLQSERHEREKLLGKLSAQLKKQRSEIATLKRDEQRMTQLVERLNRLVAEKAAREKAAREKAAKAAKAPAKSAARPPLGVNTRTPEPFQTDKPFSRLKGSLSLPVAGELMNRFGAPREGGGVNWKGYFIRAPQGSVVKAIAAGQVVFSEWLRGFGNLIIVDHGEGYMSLYSNNESLYKQVGDPVQPGDAIASVGNSGGQSDSGLYFEMRHQSRPINPMHWVK
ncbi:MAG: peptidoglycan DD-metalloendopeptidase family protein [Thiobacillaceae bacterium]|nr:peptidoglycan DD-metalloendopeptidase family protein [Thiobacillaceae bacterium]